jgi:hypothetical protein
MRAFGWVACLLLGCSPATPPKSEPSAEQEARSVCESVMRRTRECKEAYVPALLRARARFDQPPGIRARYEAEAEEKLLPIAREEFESDWADAGIEQHCEKLVAKPAEERAQIVERERSCLPTRDCEAFVACNVALLESKWGAKSP